MAFDNVLVSKHGRKFGLSSSNGLLLSSSDGYSHAAEISSAGVFESSISSFGSTIGVLPVARVDSEVDTVTASDATLNGYGFAHISSDVINGSVITVPAPTAAGQNLDIWCDTSASTVSLNSTAAANKFGSSVDSSALVLDAAGGIRGKGVVLRGISDTRWAILATRNLGD